MNSWNNLSIKEKADVMKVAIQNGITTLPEIKAKYNEFAEGGNLYAGTSTDDDLIDWIIKEEGFNKKPENIGDGKITLGSGLTDPKWHELYKKRGNVWSAEDNRRAVAEEVAKRRKWAETNIPNWDTLPITAQKALISYKYNYNFNKQNSPKLYKALADSDLYEAARQMNATSKDPKFQEGLKKRRQREQEWFLSGVRPPKPDPNVELPVSTRISNPYAIQAKNTRMLPVNVPEEGSYIRTVTLSPEQQRRINTINALKAVTNFNQFMEDISIPNTAPEPFIVGSRAYGGNLFSGTENHSSQMLQGHVYDVLPRMLRNAGLDVRVTSGYRKAGAAGKAGSKSWHIRHGAVDIVPQGKTTFSDIENALYNNPEISSYMLANGFGLIDESGRTEESKATMRKTGATGAHFHIGKDSAYAKRYADRMSKNVPQIMPESPSIQAYDAPAFMPSNPQAFFNPFAYQAPQIKPEIEQPLVEAALNNAYTPEQLEREQRMNNLNTLSMILGMTSTQGSDNSFVNTLGMLAGNMSAYGGHIYGGTSEQSQKMNRPNIFRYDDGRYVYQAAPNAKEIDVIPINTLMPDASQWTYQDAEGKIYTPNTQVSTGTLTEAEDTNPLMRAANNYVRELEWRAKNDPSSIALQGKYTMPAVALAATGIGGFIDSPIAATGALIEGELAGKTVNGLSSLFTGKDWGENISNLTGLDYALASITNPGYLIGGQAGYSGGKTIARGVKQDRLLGRNYSPEEVVAYQNIFGRDISELQNQTAIRALVKGSPNLGNEYGIFDNSNPIYHPKEFTSWLAEMGNYSIPFAGPIKTPARVVARNIASQSSSPERLKADWHSVIHKGPFNGVIGSDTGFQTDIEKAYPGINFVDYYLWRDDPILRWAPSVRTTTRYFKENPAPFRTSFGEKYDLYGNNPQGQMPLKSVDTHFKETAAFSLPGYKATPFKTEEGITQMGINRMLTAHKFSNNIEPLKLGEWSGMDDLWNSSIPELNIAGHQVFVNPINGEVLSRDIWKYNPWDWKKKWGTLGGKAAQAGIMDKLGTPFITTARVPLSPEAISYLNQ